MGPSQPDEQAKKAKVTLTTANKILIAIGLAGVVQYLACSLIGLIRGYSIQSYWPQYICLAGCLLLLAPIYLFALQNKNHPVLSKLSVISSLFLIYMMLPGFFLGNHRQAGDELYEQHDYAAALAEYQEETNTWYLRLKYNYNEAPGTYRIGQCYAQLGEFNKAREFYQQTTDRFHGLYHERAMESLAELDTILPDIEKKKAQLIALKDDREKTNLLFDIALLYRKIDCDQKAIEQYQAIQKLNLPESTKEMAHEFARKLKEPDKY